MTGVIDTTLFGLVHDFFKVYLPKQKRSSQHTIRSYRTALDSLFEFVKKEKNVQLSEITFEMIDSNILSSFLDHVEENGAGITTRNHRLNSIRSFYTYAATMNPIIVIHKSEICKVPIKKPMEQNAIDYLSEDAVKELLKAPDVGTKKGLRDQFIMLFMYDTAARIAEIISIQLCDIHLGKTPTVTLHGKRSKIRTVPIMKQTVAHLKNYMKEFHSDTNFYSACPLFYSMRLGEKQVLDDSTIRKMIHTYGQKAKLVCPTVPEKVHPHLLRHSRAMHLYQHGMDLTLVAQWLGHAQIDTTLIYAHADTEQKRKAIETATQIDSPLKEKLNPKRFTVDDDETLKKLYGLK